MHVGIIVPFYKGYAYLKELIPSVELAARGLNCTLLIVDNSPEDLPIEIPTGLQIRLEIIREKPAIGYGKACNRGFRRCKELGCDHVIITNQDGYFSEHLIRNLILPFEKDTSILVSAPLLKIYGHEEVEEFFIKFYLSQIPRFFSDMLLGKPKDYYEMEVISGACFAFRMKDPRYVYDYLFDPVFHMYYEDEDFCRRIKLVGGKIILVTRGAEFYHQHSDTTDTENRDVIEFNKLLAEKIFRVKDPSSPVVKGIYGVLATSFTNGISHLLRGRVRGVWEEVCAVSIFLYRLPQITKTRRQEIWLGRQQN